MTIRDHLQKLLAWPTSAPASVVEAARAALAEPVEPFGYFRADAFGWTNCAETDEGAKPLYEGPVEKLTEFQLGLLVMEHLGPEALAGGQMSILDSFCLGVQAAEKHYNITGRKQ